jgi:protein O-GlcNAc transferase
MPPFANVWAAAVRHHRAQQFKAADALYRELLAARPDFADAWHNWGALAFQTGQAQVALERIERAIELAPAHAAAHYDRGLILQDLSRLDEAAASYARALALQPDNAEAHNNLGNVLARQGRLWEAIASYRRAIERKPDHAAAHNNLGGVLKEQGDLAAAAEAFSEAIHHQPHLAEAHNNLGKTRQAQGRLTEAADCYRRAIALKPVLAEAHFNLGTVYRATGNLDSAMACYRRTIELQPDHAAAHSNLGNALKEQSRFAEAEACYRRALELDPQLVEAWNNLGTALQQQGRVEEAVNCYRRALAAKPDFVEALNNLATAYYDQRRLDEAAALHRQVVAIRPSYAEAWNNLGTVLKDQGRVGEAIASYRRALELPGASPWTYSNLLYTLQFSSDYDAASILAEHRRWNEQHVGPIARATTTHDNDPSPGRRLRIGYVSPDFRSHCQALFMLPLLTAHDHTACEIFCYSDAACEDHVTERLRPLADAWRRIVGKSDADVARLIRDDRIDVLVDLTMHMSRNRQLLFAQRPAPVQICWLAYPGTTGNEAIDYRLTDPYLDPPGEANQHSREADQHSGEADQHSGEADQHSGEADQHSSETDQRYSETSLRLEDTFWCFHPLTSEPAVNRLPALSRGTVTFGCFNNFCKLNPAVLQLWARVLHAVPGSRLILLAPEGSCRQWPLDVLTAEGIDNDRLTFVAPRPRADYLGLYHEIDAALDTFPYGGHTTSLDAYWMGVPVLTLVGQTVVGRAGLSQLNNLGLTELIAYTPEQFIAIAASLAADLPRLAELRATLRRRLEVSPLMNAPRFASSLENAYRAAWRRWRGRGAGRSDLASD